MTHSDFLELVQATLKKSKEQVAISRASMAQYQLAKIRPPRETKPLEVARDI